jgi:hypothetical protein
MSAANLQVAGTILAQLGGRRFIAMTGAHSFSSSAEALSLRIPPAKEGIIGVVITLTPADVYQVKFFARRPFPECVRLVETCDDIYEDALQDCFTRVTGLATHL